MKPTLAIAALLLAAPGFAADEPIDREVFEAVTSQVE